jgi:hypothetical protein
MGSNSHGSGKQEARSAEQASNRSPKNVQDAALTYVKELRKAGRERPEVTLDEIGSTSSGKQQTQSHGQGSKRPPKDIQDVALTYVKGLRKAGYERPQVTLIEKGVKASDDVAAAQFPKEWSKTPTPSSSSLPPCDSPLTKAFLGQYITLLVLETVICLKLSYKGLAQKMSMPETVLREAMQGKLGLTRGQWVKLGQLLKIATNFQLVKSERNGAPCWEVCYPPVPARIDKQ